MVLAVFDRVELLIGVVLFEKTKETFCTWKGASLGPVRSILSNRQVLVLKLANSTNVRSLLSLGYMDFSRSNEICQETFQIECSTI